MKFSDKNLTLIESPGGRVELLYGIYSYSVYKLEKFIGLKKFNVCWLW